MLKKNAWFPIFFRCELLQFCAALPVCSAARPHGSRRSGTFQSNHSRNVHFSSDSLVKISPSESLFLKFVQQIFEQLILCLLWQYQSPKVSVQLLLLVRCCLLTK